MKSVRAMVATVSIAAVGIVGVAASSNALTAASHSAPMILCAAVSQSVDKAVVGSSVHLKVTMPPYTVTVTGVVQNDGAFQNTIVHPLNVSIVDDGEAVGVSTLLAYSGGGLGGMSVGKDLAHPSTLNAGLCLAKFVGAPQPAVVVPIGGPYTQGNFSSIDIFPLSPDETMLSPLSEDLAVTGCELLITSKGVLIASGDSSFLGRFSDYADSVSPLLLTVPVFGDSTHDVPGRIENVTSDYPSLLKANATSLWAAFVHPSNGVGLYPFGVLAAWVADETRLHAEAAAIAKVDSAVVTKRIRFPNFGISGLKDFNSEIRQFLETQGYS